MELEFHYYMTYLIAVRAGFRPADAFIIAQSSQGVDDNHIPIEVAAGTAAAYTNATSQTMDITRPHEDRRIYPIFHFIPGVADAPSARRKDGRRDVLVTTPNGPIANEMIDSALASKDLYRIGASAHSYVDTWAHQNFAGINDDFNALPLEGASERQGAVQQALNVVLNIGHAPAGHMPDLPGLTWTDTRLIDEIATINNKARFLEAAGFLFEKFYRYTHAAVDIALLRQETTALRADLNVDIGGPDDENFQSAQRIQRYQRRAALSQYGGTQLPTYSEELWPSAALVGSRQDLLNWLVQKLAGGVGEYGDLVRMGLRAQCAWKDPVGYKSSDWYKFQEAIKAHVEGCWVILVKHIPWLAN